MKVPRSVYDRQKKVIEHAVDLSCFEFLRRAEEDFDMMNDLSVTIKLAAEIAIVAAMSPLAWEIVDD